MNRRLRAVEQHDPFNFQHGGYDKEQFYTRSLDKKGHKDTVYVPFPPNVLAAISEIVQKRAIPEYRTAQDFIRDATVHRLREVSEMLEDGRLRKLLDVEMRYTRMEQRREELKHLNNLLSVTEEALKDAVQAGDKGFLKETISEAEEELHELKEPWRSRMTDLLDRYRDKLK